MDAFTDPGVEEITVQKVPQSGGTEAIYNMIGYCISEDPGPAMLTMPREEDCDYAAHNRLKPMVEGSADLLGHTTGRIWDLSKQEFHFDRMTLYFAGSNSPAGLGSKPIRFLFLDETDKYPPFAGKEANPIDLAVKRTLTYWDRKIVKVSTSTSRTGHINISYRRSNRQQYYIPCPHCGEYSVWKFAQLRIAKELRKPDEIRRKAGCVWYECEHCGKRIDENRRQQLIGRGVWLAEGLKIDADGNITGKPVRDKRHSGFQFSALVSPWVSWPEIMAQWFEANTEEGVAVGKLLDFKNSILGEPFEETAKRIKAADVRRLKGGFSRGTVPTDCVMLVASADYHKTRVKKIVRIDYEVRGFAYGMKNYVVNSGWVGSFDELDKVVFESPYPWADGTPAEKKPLLAVMVMFIDSGYEPDDVYEYCRGKPGLCIPAKGEPGPRTKPLQASELESATEWRLNRRQRARFRGMRLILVDTYYFKDQVTSWAEPRTDEDDKIIAEPLTAFYDEIESYYFTEFTNEQKVSVRDRRGNVKWIWTPVTTGAATHALDTAVLAAAAAYYKGAHYWRRPGQKKQPALATGGRPRPRRRGGGFLDDLPEL
jgi:phage terminase large subunit GpA-like protein